MRAATAALWLLAAPRAGAKPPPGAAGSQLPLLAATTAPITLDEVLARFEEHEARVRGLSARFKQSVLMEEAGVSQSSEGTVSFAKPRLLRIEHARPQRQTLVADGKTLWIWRPDPGQVIEADLDEWLGSEPLALSLMDLGGYGSLAKRYQLSISTVGAPGPDGHRTVSLVMKPRAPGAHFELLVSLSTRDFFPAEATLSAGRVRVTTRFDEVRLNPAFEPAAFRFAAPAGSEVLGNIRPPLIK